MLTIQIIDNLLIIWISFKIKKTILKLNEIANQVFLSCLDHVKTSNAFFSKLTLGKFVLFIHDASYVFLGTTNPSCSLIFIFMITIISFFNHHRDLTSFLHVQLSLVSSFMLLYLHLIELTMIQCFLQFA